MKLVQSVCSWSFCGPVVMALMLLTQYTHAQQPLHDFSEDGYFYFWDYEGFPDPVMPPLDFATAPIEDQLAWHFHYSEQTYFAICLFRSEKKAEQYRQRKEEDYGVGRRHIAYVMPEGKDTYLLWGRVPLTMNGAWYMKPVQIFDLGPDDHPKGKWRLW